VLIPYYFGGRSLWLLSIIGAKIYLAGETKSSAPDSVATSIDRLRLGSFSSLTIEEIQCKMPAGRGTRAPSGVVPFDRRKSSNNVSNGMLLLACLTNYLWFLYHFANSSLL
jgi:hypothetical protein